MERASSIRLSISICVVSIALVLMRGLVSRCSRYNSSRRLLYFGAWEFYQLPHLIRRKRGAVSVQALPCVELDQSRHKPPHKLWVSICESAFESCLPPGSLEPENRLLGPRFANGLFEELSLTLFIPCDYAL
jgi:hypothetical protein